MARARKDIAGRRRGDGAEAPADDAIASGGAAGVPGLPPQMLALSGLPPQHREQILALVRAMARDAACADHAAGRDGDDA